MVRTSIYVFKFVLNLKPHYWKASLCENVSDQPFELDTGSHCASWYPIEFFIPISWFPKRIYQKPVRASIPTLGARNQQGYDTG